MSRFRRRLMTLEQQRQKFANDFQRVEYIENTSTAYINTGIKGYNSISIDCDIEFTVLPSSAIIFGNRNKNDAIDTSSNYSYGYYINSENNFATMVNRTASNYADYTVEANLRYNISGTARNTTITYKGIDEETEEIVDKSFTFTNGGSNSGTYSRVAYFLNINQPTFNNARATKAKVYYLKIYNGTTLVRDYIPMLQISTGKYGLWDRVTQEFYVSPNGVNFNGGEPVIADANENLYYYRNYILTNNDSKRCTFGIYPNGTDYWETKIYFPSTARNYAMGAWSSNNSNMYGIQAVTSTIKFAYHSGTIDYSGTYSQRTFTFKQIFDNDAKVMHFYLYDANNNELMHKTAAQRGGTSSRLMMIGDFNGSSYGSTNNTRFYYLKYWRNQTLVRDMIPAENVATGEYCFFDKVNLVAYYSSPNPFTSA